MYRDDGQWNGGCPVGTTGGVKCPSPGPAYPSPHWCRRRPAGATSGACRTYTSPGNSGYRTLPPETRDTGDHPNDGSILSNPPRVSSMLNQELFLSNQRRGRRNCKAITHFGGHVFWVRQSFCHIDCPSPYTVGTCSEQCSSLPGDHPPTRPVARVHGPESGGPRFSSLSRLRLQTGGGLAVGHPERPKVENWNKSRELPAPIYPIYRFAWLRPPGSYTTCSPEFWMCVVRGASQPSAGNTIKFRLSTGRIFEREMKSRLPCLA